MEDEDQNITAYHGSPHDFEQFDIGKIGTGEGAQAYGRGLYFAEAEPVAKEYRDKLTEGTYKTSTGEIFDPYKNLEHMNVRVAAYKNIENAIERAKGLLEDQPENADKINRDLQKLYAAKEAQAAPHPGHMYEVGIDAHPDHFLDWDKPFNKQSDYVRDSLINWNLADSENHKDSTGKKIYHRTGGISELLGRENEDPSRHAIAVAKLANAGIKGIKYLDRGSRAAGEDPPPRPPRRLSPKPPRLPVLLRRLWALGRASATLTFCPFKSLLFIPPIAARASLLEGICTNPKPLDSPLTLSFTIFTDMTCPKASKAPRKSSSLTSLDKLPT